MSEHDKDLTVVLLLKDRPKFTRRWMAYAEAVRYPFKVLAADGGVDPSVASLLTGRNYPNVDCCYLRCPPDDTYAHYHAKVLDAVRQVKTPYVKLECNDDFTFLDAMREGVAFLKENPGYVSATGTHYDFSVIPAAPEIASLAPVLGTVALGAKTYPTMTLPDERALDRIERFMFGLMNSGPWPAIHRTDALRRTYEMIVEVDPKDLRLADQMVPLALASQGRIHGGLDAYSLHQANTGESAGASIAQEFPTWFHWFRAPHWRDQFDAFVGVIGRAIAATDRMDAEEAVTRFQRLYLGLVGEQLLNVFHPAPSHEETANIIAANRDAVLIRPEMRQIAGFLQRSALRNAQPDVAQPA